MQQVKYCSACMKDRPADGGRYIMTARNRIKRWKCAICVANKNVSPFASKARK